jgi:biopolymer transport protein ExbD
VKNKATILIAIDQNNRLFMDHREIDPRAVRANVERALAENPEGAVVVVADKASSTGVAIQVMDGCRMAGAENVSLAASVPQGV